MVDCDLVLDYLYCNNMSVWCFFFLFVMLGIYDYFSWLMDNGIYMVNFYIIGDEVLLWMFGCFFFNCL